MFLGNAIIEKEIQELKRDLNFVKSQTTKSVIEKAISDKEKKLETSRKFDWRCNA